MMAAARKGHLKKKRSDPTRSRMPDPVPSPAEARRSLRPRQCRYLADLEDELDLDEEEERERESRERRKVKLVVKLPSPLTAPRSRKVELSRHVSRPDWSPSTSGSSTSSDDDDDEEIVKPLKKRRIERGQDSDGSGHREGSKRNVVRRTIPAVSGTPMPEKYTLEAILDKLQKKDTYGVFAEPVDLDELPDYRDVIEHPMDFGTVRRKLAGGRYRSFEQFEDDVFLICSNAMQYNAPDTIYFRQAHSIQDMARKNFQEIRADLMSNGAERRSGENIRSASNEKKMVNNFHGGLALKPLSFDAPSLEKMTSRQPQCVSTLKPLSHDISSMEKNTLKKQHRTAPATPDSDIFSIEKNTLKKPHYKNAPRPPGSDISSVERKTLKKPQYKIAPGPPVSNVSSAEKKIPKKHEYKNAPGPPSSVVSSVENKTVKKPQHRSALEPPVSDVSSMGKMEVKSIRYQTAPEPSGSNISSMEKKKVKKTRYRCVPETKRTDISSWEKKKVKKSQYVTRPKPLDSDTSSMEKERAEPVGSDVSSQDKKSQKEHQGRTAPDPLGSDNSSAATLASAADTFTDLSKIPAIDAPAKETCTGLSMAQDNGIGLAEDTCTELNTEKSSGVERPSTANGSVDGSSLGESKSQKADEVPAKCSPSKIKLKPVDMNRRMTYNVLEEQPSVESDPVFDVFEGETRQLVTVGLDSEYAYARSLARFAGPLGPIAWEIASKKIGQALPPGVKFGPGWVGEYEPLLTPVLSLESNTIKSNSISTISKKDKQNEIMPETIRKNNQHKDMPFGPKIPKTTGMPNNIKSNPSNVGRERAQEKKQGLFGVNLEPQPNTASSRMTHQQQTIQPAGDFAPRHRLGIFSEAANSTSPRMISMGFNQVQAQPQKPQQQKNLVPANFPKACINETTKHPPELLYSEAPTSNYPAINYMQPRPMKQPEAVTSHRTNDGLVMNFGGSNNFNSPYSIITNHQAGAQYWLPRPNQEQAINDPLKWMNSSGKFSNQPTTLNKCTVQIPKIESPSAAASPTWISIKNPSPTSRVHEATKIKPEFLQGVSENSQGPMKGLVIFPQLMTTTDLSRLRSPRQGLVPHHKQKYSFPPDLNISFQPLESPARSSSSVHMDSQQPDLALQL